MGKKVISKSGSLDYVLFISWVGALIFFVQKSEGFGGFIVAIFQSFVWPAYVVFEVLERLVG